MSFLYRLGYFLGGFSAGLVILFFLFNGKRTQCNYGPEEKNIIWEVENCAKTVYVTDIKFNP